MTAVHQCPRCDLRFSDSWQLEDHLAADHAGQPVGRARPIRLDDAAVERALRELPGWRRHGAELVREYELPSFAAAIAFVNRVADAAEAADHHPDMDIRYRRVRVALTTHSEGGLTTLDVALAGEVDRCAATS